MQLEVNLIDWATRTPPKAGLILNRLTAQNEALAFFTLGEWQMSNGNVLRMLAETSEFERQLFPFDLTKLDWSVYCRQFIPGVVRYAIEPRIVKTRDAGGHS